MSLSLSPQIQKIIDDWQYHKLVLPSWFVKNNMNWVISGHITESEFLSGFNNLLNSGIAYYVSPEPTPQPLTSYWVAKPSQINTSASYPFSQNFRAEMYSITESTKQKWLDKGYILSDTQPVYQSGHVLWQGQTSFGKGICTNKAGERYTLVIPCYTPPEPEPPEPEPPEPEPPEPEPPEPEPPALLSANIKISFTNPNIGGFSSSIPIDDIGKLQILSNTAPEWKYTLIGSSTNPPLTTLNELIITINDLLPNITITDNMITQQLINFNIVNGRAVGSIKFVATNNFNPFYYGKNIVNIIQFKDPNGAKILDVVKENRLNFTETERDEVITYDEDMKGNTRATVESVVWSSATQPTAFSKMFGIEISEKEPPKPIQAGFMGAGAIGALAGLILIGFIADHKRGK